MNLYVKCSNLAQFRSNRKHSPRIKTGLTQCTRAQWFGSKRRRSAHGSRFWGGLFVSQRFVQWSLFPKRPCHHWGIPCTNRMLHVETVPQLYLRASYTFSNYLMAPYHHFLHSLYWHWHYEPWLHINLVVQKWHSKRVLVFSIGLTYVPLYSQEARPCVSHYWA